MHLPSAGRGTAGGSRSDLPKATAGEGKKHPLGMELQGPAPRCSPCPHSVTLAKGALLLVKPSGNNS